MRAMVLPSFGGPLVADEVARPEPGPGEVLVRVRACGICYTDIKIRDGLLPKDYLPAKMPHILGHEVAGEVAAIGPGVKEVSEGDRVVVYHISPCMNCYLCRSGFESSCENPRKVVGFVHDGGFAEYVVAPASNVAPLDPSIPFTHGAVIGDAIATTLYGLRDRAGVRAGETVLIMGAGGLGLHAVQVANLLGAEVFVTDKVPEKLEWARKVGASGAGLSSDDTIVDQIVQWSGGHGVDVVVDLAGVAATVELGTKVLRKGGRLLMLGYRADTDFKVPSGDLVLKQLQVLGSRATKIQTFRDTVKFVNAGKIKPAVTDVFPLEQANEALAKLEKGQFIGRAVLEVK